jgi:hypothetical protein
MAAADLSQLKMASCRKLIPFILKDAAFRAHFADALVNL